MQEAVPEPKVLWDPRKARSNLRKHKIPFEEAATVFRDSLSITKPDQDHSADENRFLTLGLSFRHRLVLVAHTEDPNEIRIISARMPTKTSESKKFKDTMRREYDLTGGVRGKYAGRFKKDVVMVPIAPDVAAAFPDADSVNEALRVLLKAAKKVAPAA